MNDHLRLVDSERRLEIQSGDVHEVRPWFTGRLDFAPIVPLPGDGELPLRGGAIERFLDRDAAAFVFGRRRHAVSLLVFRAEGLPWPDRGLVLLGEHRALTATVRGFNVVLWRAGELGYALVSDIGASELRELALRFATSPR